jgi:Holliday junction resolvasome RuvABC endonuclease subunit
MIGIDPSLNGTGLAYYANGSIETTRIGVKKFRGVHRLRYVRDMVREYISSQDVAVYEDYAFGAKGAAIFQIGELGGVLKTLCYEEGVDVLLVPPSVLKLFTTGKGNAKKDVMAAAVLEKYGVSLGSDDEVDAYALLKLGTVFYDKRSFRCLNGKVRTSLATCEVTHGKSCR